MIVGMILKLFIGSYVRETKAPPHRHEFILLRPTRLTAADLYTRSRAKQNFVVRLMDRDEGSSRYGRLRSNLEVRGSVKYSSAESHIRLVRSDTKEKVMRKFLVLALVPMFFAVTACQKSEETPAPEASAPAAAASEAAPAASSAASEAASPAASEAGSPAASPAAS
jgi:hypothetical protein